MRETLRAPQPSRLAYVDALILVGFLIVLLADSALACSCDRRFSVEDYYSKTRAIFVARVTEILPPNTYDGRDIVRGKFQISEVVKGNPAVIPFVESGVPRGANCNLDLREGRSYLFVFLDSNFVTWCSSGSPTTDPYQKWLVEYRALRARLK